MDLIGHLSCFVAVADELHFGRAAQRLGMAQPPLSQRIQRLERELGVRLFDRSSRRVELTPSGRHLLDEARDLLARADRVYSIADRDAPAGALRLGLPPTLGGPVLAAVIAAFAARRPDLRLEPRELGTVEQLRGLADGTLDTGVLRHPCDVRGLELGPVLGRPLGVLLAPGSAPPGPVHLSDLAGRELAAVPRDEEPGAHEETLATCRRYGFDPAIVHEIRDPRFAAGLVLTGSTVALAAAEEAVAGPEWRPLAGEPLHWRVSAAWRDRGGPAAELAETVTQVLHDQAGVQPATARRVVARPAAGFLA